MINEVALQGSLETRESLKYFLSGAAVSRFTLRYEGKQTEAGGERKLKFSADCVALGTLGESLDKVPLGTEIKIKGFLAPSSSRSKKLLVHITEYEKGV